MACVSCTGSNGDIGFRIVGLLLDWVGTKGLSTYSQYSVPPRVSIMYP